MKHASAESLIAVTGKNVTFFRSYLSSLSAPPMQLAFSGSNSRSYLSVLDFSCPTPRAKGAPESRRFLRIWPQIVIECMWR